MMSQQIKNILHNILKTLWSEIELQILKVRKGKDMQKTIARKKMYEEYLHKKNNANDEMDSQTTASANSKKHN